MKPEPTPLRIASPWGMGIWKRRKNSCIGSPGSPGIWGSCIWVRTGAVVVRPVIAVTGAAWQVIGLRVVDRLGEGLRTPPRDALIADVTPAGLRGRAFGLQRGMDHAGAVLGPILAWWLLAPGGGSANVRAV